VIVFGVCPGLSAVAYSVLLCEGSGLALPLDNDVLHAGRGVVPRTAAEIAKRWRAHTLILDVVFERNPPALLAVGPPADSSEPAEHVFAARLAAKGIATLLRIPWRDYASMPDLLGALGVDRPRIMTSEVKRSLRGVLGTRDRRVLTATAAAIAAYRHHRAGLDPG